MKFERVGCFTYSPEDGTPAYSMPEQIDEETKRRRADIVMSEQLAIAEEFARSWIGRELEVVVEGLNEETGIYYGRAIWMLRILIPGSTSIRPMSMRPVSMSW